MIINEDKILEPRCRVEQQEGGEALEMIHQQITRVANRGRVILNGTRRKMTLERTVYPKTKRGRTF